LLNQTLPDSNAQKGSKYFYEGNIVNCRRATFGKNLMLLGFARTKIQKLLSKKNVAGADSSLKHLQNSIQKFKIYSYALQALISENEPQMTL